MLGQELLDWSSRYRRCDSCHVPMALGNTAVSGGGKDDGVGTSVDSHTCFQASQSLSVLYVLIFFSYFPKTLLMVCIGNVLQLHYLVPFTLYCLHSFSVRVKSFFFLVFPVS